MYLPSSSEQQLQQHASSTGTAAAGRAAASTSEKTRGDNNNNTTGGSPKRAREGSQPQIENNGNTATARNNNNRKLSPLKDEANDTGDVLDSSTENQRDKKRPRLEDAGDIAFPFSSSSSSSSSSSLAAKKGGAGGGSGLANSLFSSSSMFSLQALASLGSATSLSLSSAFSPFSSMNSLPSFAQLQAQHAVTFPALEDSDDFLPAHIRDLNTDFFGSFPPRGALLATTGNTSSINRSSEEQQQSTNVAAPSSSISVSKPSSSKPSSEAPSLQQQQPQAKTSLPSSLSSGQTEKVGSASETILSDSTSREALTSGSAPSSSNSATTTKASHPIPVRFFPPSICVPPHHYQHRPPHYYQRRQKSPTAISHRGSNPVDDESLPPLAPVFNDGDKRGLLFDKQHEHQQHRHQRRYHHLQPLPPHAAAPKFAIATPPSDLPSSRDDSSSPPPAAPQMDALLSSSYGDKSANGGGSGKVVAILMDGGDYNGGGELFGERIGGDGSSDGGRVSDYGHNYSLNLPSHHDFPFSSSYQRAGGQPTNFPADTSSRGEPYAWPRVPSSAYPPHSYSHSQYQHSQPPHPSQLSPGRAPATVGGGLRGTDLTHGGNLESGHSAFSGSPKHHSSSSPPSSSGTVPGNVPSLRAGDNYSPRYPFSDSSYSTSRGGGGSNYHPYPPSSSTASSLSSASASASSGYGYYRHRPLQMYETGSAAQRPASSSSAYGYPLPFPLSIPSAKHQQQLPLQQPYPPPIPPSHHGSDGLGKEEEESEDSPPLSPEGFDGHLLHSPEEGVASRALHNKTAKRLSASLNQIPGLDKIRWQSVLQDTRSTQVGDRETQRRVKEAEILGTRLFGGDMDKLLSSVLAQHPDFVLRYVTMLRDSPKKRHRNLASQLRAILGEEKPPSG